MNADKHESMSAVYSLDPNLRFKHFSFFVLFSGITSVILHSMDVTRNLFYSNSGSV